jgi:DNA-directed RNA polymerase subunit RPC12/RpoP
MDRVSMNPTDAEDGMQLVHVEECTQTLLQECHFCNKWGNENFEVTVRRIESASLKKYVCGDCSKFLLLAFDMVFEEPLKGAKKTGKDLVVRIMFLQKRDASDAIEDAKDEMCLICEALMDEWGVMCISHFDSIVLAKLCYICQDCAADISDARSILLNSES